MRIVEYNGVPVKRQKRINKWGSPHEIRVVFYDRPPIVVTPEEWEANAKNKYFDNPSIRRCNVVRQNAVVTH
jgi:hypothetical protein